MAGFNTINAYDADCRIPAFLGLRQYGDPINGDPRYSIESENMDTIGGALQPFAACRKMPHGFEDNAVETLMWFYRRWAGGDDKEILVAACDGFLHVQENDQWMQVTMPAGVERFESNVWSWVTYEVNEADPDTGEALPTIDVLLLSNAKDGMFMLRGDDLTLQQVPTPYKFGVITRYAERIWGSAIEDDPDVLAYSAPYDPTDWKTRVPDPSQIVDPDWQVVGQPEDGAGDIQQPSWGGDAFTALKAFGAQLVAFKRTRVWRVLGTDPGEYAFKEQFGGGTPFPATIAVDAERILMLGQQGVMMYDGNTVAPFQQEVCKEVWNRVNKDAMDQSCACLWRQKYYVAIPIDGSDICNAILTYSVVDGTWLLRTDMSVESWLPTENHLYFTSSTTPGYIWEYFEDAWTRNEASGAATRWVTPWNNLNYQDMRKGPFRIYLTPEVKDKPVDLTITLDTDGRRRSKTVRIHPLLDVEQYYHREMKPVCIHIAGGGRRFRLIISTDEGAPVWRITGGVHIVADISGD